MDVGTFVGWIQLAIWVVGILIGIGRIVSGKKQMPRWLTKLVASNVLIGIVVCSGFALSIVQLHRQLTYECVKISDLDGRTFPINSLERVEGQNFNSETVEVDGKYFEDCTFTNATLLLHGKRTEAFYHATWNGSTTVMTDNPIIATYLEMLIAFKPFDSNRVLVREDHQGKMWVTIALSGDYEYDANPRSGRPRQFTPLPQSPTPSPQ
jgi:hypothetical protein